MTNQITWGFIKFKADPVKCYAELQSLGDEYTPDQVLDFARDGRTELHKCFDWDDSSAAEKWRKQQARMICQSLTVTVQREESDPIRYRIIQHDNEQKVYRGITYTVRDDEQYARLLRQAKQELSAFRKRYKSLVELENIIEEIERIIG